MVRVQKVGHITLKEETFIDTNFVSMNFFKIGHPRKLIGAKFFKVVYLEILFLQNLKIGYQKYRKHRNTKDNFKLSDFEHTLKWHKEIKTYAFSCNIFVFS